MSRYLSMSSLVRPLRPILLGLSLTLLCACQPVILSYSSAELHGDIVWRGEVRIAGDLVVDRDAHLRIEPGTRVLFLPPSPGADRFQVHPHFPGSELIIRGQVVAVGAVDQPIEFRFHKVDGGPGSWGGINVIQSRSGIFRYCLFQQADSALHIQTSNVHIEQSIFRYNKVGLRFHSSDLVALSNLFEENGTAIRFHFGAPKISRNLIRNNDKGLFMTSHPQDYSIHHNSFENNRSYQVVLGEEVPETVLLPENWWGSSALEDIRRQFFDRGVDSDLGSVLIKPVLTRPDDHAGPRWSR